MKSNKRNRFKNKTEILNCLWNYQNKYGFIRDEDVDECCKSFDISKVDLEGVISFYHFFHRQPAGKFTIYLNNSIVSEFKGFQRVKEAFERETGAVFGKVDPSGQFGLFETSCIGLSDQEPAALIDFFPFTNLTTLKVKSIIAQLKRGVSPESICDEIHDHVRWTPKEDKTVLLRHYAPGKILGQVKKLKPQEVIDKVKASQLAGMGGAFFPTGLKWEFCKKEPGNPKYIVCNADEGEPGTFKDRILLNSYSGLLLEGMITAGYAVGAKQGIIYLRAEYWWLKSKIERQIEHFYKMNLLGKEVLGIPDFDFDIKIQMGAGAYVCGEETALLNSLEGKRGEPRTKFYFPTQRGYLDKPTVVNNVETFCAAARIMELGVDFFLNTGTATSPGTKLISVSGDCHLPGIYEIEHGTSISEIVYRYEAKDPRFIQISGPSGLCFTMDEIEKTIAKDDVRCGGSFMVFNDRREILDILINFSKFFKIESCGVCTPCRAGNFIVQRKLDRIKLGLAYPVDFKEIKEWGEIMELTSRCGLGKAATNTLRMALEKFPDYFEGKVDHHEAGLNKTFHIEKAVEEYDKFCS